jgi:hypothetical protein
MVAAVRLWVVMWLVSGCAAQAVDAGPEVAIARWADALERGDPEAAHALLDDETRRTRSVEDVRERLEANPGEVAEHVAAVRTTEPRARAVVRLTNDERVTLHREDGHWRLSGALLGVPTPTTPEDAVRALRRALRHPALDGVLAVLARRPRAGIVAEVERFLADSADELAWRTEVAGNDASVRTAGGWTIRLVRESGEWRVADVVASTP